MEYEIKSMIEKLLFLNKLNANDLKQLEAMPLFEQRTFLKRMIFEGCSFTRCINYQKGVTT